MHCINLLVIIVFYSVQEKQKSKINGKINHYKSGLIGFRKLPDLHFGCITNIKCCFRSLTLFHRMALIYLNWSVMLVKVPTLHKNCRNSCMRKTTWNRYCIHFMVPIKHCYTSTWRFCVKTSTATLQSFYPEVFV